MRTPSQIKRALARCRDDHCVCDECVFSDGNVKKWRSLMGDALIYIEQLEHSVDVAPAITGETSDGYHTFNELYHHRAVLFSVIVKAFPYRSWKARKHHDGTMYDGMFIVGIETRDGQATYHFDIEPYWDMFECEELEYAPEWDGHTPDEAICRIGKLKNLLV